MLREYDYIFHRANMAADLVLGAVSVLVAHLIRNTVVAPYLIPEILTTPSRFADYAWLLIAVPVALVGALAFHGHYSSQRIRSFRASLGVIMLASVQAAALAAAIGFAISAFRGVGWSPATILGGDLSLAVVVLVPFITTALIAAKTFAVRRSLMSLRQRGMNWRSLLLVGSGETLRHFIQLIREHPFWGFRLEGIIDDAGREARVVEGVPVIGGLADLLSRLEAEPVDEVVFIPSRKTLDELAPYFEACEEMGVRTRLSLNFFRHTIAHPALDMLEGYPVVTYEPAAPLNLALLFKYTLDRIAAAVMLVVLSPVFLVTAVLIKATSASWSDPVFFGQRRCGLHGRPFTLWKFRSMRVGADAELASLQELNDMSGPVFKMKNDPRITALGRFLRRTSIDELPQFWNVLRGDMSLVGPRPPIPEEVAKYNRWQRRRLSMKPGLTCLWQVMGRNKVGFDEWMKLDLQYIDHWSLWLDFRIMLRTIYVVATGYGAM